MTERSKIIEIIFQSIEDLNKENDIEIDKNINTKLFGSDSELDSILLVNLIVSVEEQIEELVGEYIPIADERAFSLDKSPFRTIKTLVDHIETLLND